MSGDKDEVKELRTLLALHGASYEFAAGYVVEFKVEVTDETPERPHGISYALVLRQKGGDPCVRFDNAHAVKRPGGPYVKRSKAYDHWHRSGRDRGRPYEFTTPLKLLKDFFREVKRVLDERGIPNDL
jgi:hypothetical protein